MKKKREAGDAVHDADHLVIGGGDQLVDQVPFGTHPGRVRADGLEFSQRGRFGCQQLLQTSGSDRGPESSNDSRILAADQADGRAGPTNCRKCVSGRRPVFGGRFPAGRMLASDRADPAARLHATARRRRLAAARGRDVQRLRVPATGATAGRGPIGLVTPTTQIAGAGVLGNDRQARRVVRAGRRRGRSGAADPTGPQCGGSQSGRGRRCPPSRSASWCSPVTSSTRCARWACSRGSSPRRCPTARRVSPPTWAARCTACPVSVPAATLT